MYIGIYFFLLKINIDVKKPFPNLLNFYFMKLKKCPGKSHSLNGKTGSTPKIPTLPNWQKPFLTHQCFHPCPSDSLISDDFEP